MDERYCTNCRAVIPPGTDVCPACGVYAGDVFDGRKPAPSGERRGGSGWIAIVIALFALAAGGWWWYTKRGQFPEPDSGPIRVVHDRPGGARQPAGAAISEPEAILTLRHYLASQPEPVRGECLAVMSRGYSNGDYVFDAVDSCARTRLGRWRVNAKTHGVSR